MEGNDDNDDDRDDDDAGEDDYDDDDYDDDDDNESIYDIQCLKSWMFQSNAHWK